MNSQEARILLEAYRPGGADQSNPRFAEALSQAQRDPELARWFADQRRFDAAVGEGLKAITAPEDLRETLLASRRIIRPALWRSTRARVALAACLAGAALIGAAMIWRTPVEFAELRNVLIKEAWDDEGHLTFASSDMTSIKSWLIRDGVNADFSVPDGLQGARPVGCRTVEVSGHRVPMLCLADGNRHVHLFVLDQADVSGLPQHGAPDFQKCGPWKTASWQKDGKTYVLAGMKYQTFVTRFRKSGRWTMSG